MAVNDKHYTGGETEGGITSSYANNDGVQLKVPYSFMGSIYDEAEREAVRRGCHHVHLDTMSWQAPDFYKNQGYEVIGILPDIPIGNQKYLLMKAL